MNRLLSAAFLIGSIASCGDDAGPSPDGGGGLVCIEPSTLAYNQPGCGTSAPAPYCQGPTDACVQSFCDCDGTTHQGGCGYALRPYRYAGPCTELDSGGDASDAGAGSNSDASDADAGSNSDASDADAGSNTDASDGNTSDADASGGDGPLVDSGDGALVCAPPTTLAYNQPGCGASTPAPYCQGPTDACLQFFCDCDGTTHSGGCGYAPRPYRYAGACVDSGSNDDAGSG